MPNKSSPHGGKVHEQVISHGTLRSQDLLRSFADELERLMPFSHHFLRAEARYIADRLDRGEEGKRWDDASELINEMTDDLNLIASREGMWFGASEGDGSDFGFWKIESEESSDEEE